MKALSPLLAMQEAVAQRAAANDLRFESDRLDASVSALRARVADLRQAEAQAVHNAERDAALAERDELAGDIAEHYPKLVRQLTDMAARIEASDARCKAIGIAESAEAIGRGVPSSFYIEGRGGVQRIGAASLPMPADVYPAWGCDTLGGPVIYRGLDV